MINFLKSYWVLLSAFLVFLSGFIFAIEPSLLHRFLDYYSHPNASESNTYELNEIGDFIGGTVGTLWGLAGTLLIYESFRVQKQDLSTQKSLFAIQQFESTFFDLLRVLREIHENIESKPGQEFHSKLKSYKVKTKEKNIEIDFNSLTFKGLIPFTDLLAELFNLTYEEVGRIKASDSKTAVSVDKYIRIIHSLIGSETEVILVLACAKSRKNKNLLINYDNCIREFSKLQET